MLVPQSMAYATLAGMPAVSGLYAATVPLVVYALLGTSGQLAFGPVAIVSLLTASTLAPIAAGDPAAYIGLAGLLAILVGVIQLLLGVLRAGRFTALLTEPVISGFTGAAAIVIATSQLPQLLGVQVDVDAGWISQIWALVQAVPATHIPTLLIGGIAIMFLLLGRGVGRWIHRQVPVALVVVILATAAVPTFGLVDTGIEVVGQVPAGLPTPTLPFAPWEGVVRLLPGAAMIAVLAYLEGISIARSIARRTGDHVDPDQELRASGAANLAAGLIQGFPVAGGFSRTAVNHQAGARTPMAGLVSALAVVLALLVFAPWLAPLPRSVLAAIVLTGVATLIDPGEARETWQTKPTDGLVMTVTFAATLIISIEVGLGVGLATSLVVGALRRRSDAAGRPRHVGTETKRRASETGTRLKECTDKSGRCEGTTQRPGPVPSVDGRPLTQQTGCIMDIVIIETPSLGDRSYLVIDGSFAAAIDPQRDIDRILDELEQRDLQLRYVLETHNHNDYVSGGLELARRTGADLVMNAEEEVFYPTRGIRDGDELPLGDSTIRAIHTPGHTPTHLAYAVTNGQRQVVFTGGSLLYGTVGRTDLVSQAQKEELTRLQFDSARRLVEELPDDATVLPTHGFGSFCSSAAADSHTSHVDPSHGIETSTIGEQRQTNLALTITDEEEFVETLFAGLDAYPRYYVHMAPRNKVGAGPIDLTPAVEADPSELGRRIHAGEWVVDLRERTAFAADHVRGTINVEVGTSFITYLAWLIPWGMPVTLVGDTQQEVDEAQLQLVRVGIDRPAAQATGGIASYGLDADRGAYRVADLDDLAELIAEGGTLPHVLDVRRDDERRRVRIEGSQHIPIHDLERRMDEIPRGVEIWVHCASGYRAAIAASLLARSGRQPVLVDDVDTGLDTVGSALARSGSSLPAGSLSVPSHLAAGNGRSTAADQPASLAP